MRDRGAEASTAENARRRVLVDISSSDTRQMARSESTHEGFIDDRQFIDQDEEGAAGQRNSSSTCAAVGDRLTGHGGDALCILHNA